MPARPRHVRRKTRPWTSPDLAEKVAVVAGATRGAGRGIAVELGAAGATVYCTGRSVRGRPATEGRPETIEETAELVDIAGGRGIALRVDHTIPRDVEALFERVRREQRGRLDILVNDIWGGEALTEWGKKFWTLTLESGLLMFDRAVKTHVITSRYGAPLMIKRNRGLIVEVTDGNEPRYRGNLYYDLVKASAIRLALGMAHDLRGKGVTALAITPGFLRSEAMLDYFGVTEASWMAGSKKDPYFAGSETPRFVGRAVACLAADRRVVRYSGKALSSWDLSDGYGFPDVDGRHPHWGRFYKRIRRTRR